MIPLILLGLLVSAGLAAYELSPRVHTWVDDHVAALSGLFAALRAANAHVEAARTTTDPAIAAQQVQAAETARAAAAQQASIAAATAKTAEQREAAARSAAAVDQLTTAISALKGFLVGVWQGADFGHAHGMHRAHAAHTAADSQIAAANAHLAAPQASPTPERAQATIEHGQAAIEHTQAADAANKDAAAASATAAANARTPEEHQVATQSTQVAVDRDKQITSIFATLGVGICGVRSYSGISSRVKDALIAQLRDAGMAVRGNNPWDIDPGKFGVKLRAAWDSRSQELKLIVTGGSSDLCPLIWLQIEPKIKEARG
jgi:hypothetical protein